MSKVKLICMFLSSILLMLSVTTSYAFDTLDGTRARWRSMPISYSIDSHSPDVDLARERDAIAAAFNAWSNVSGASIQFSSTSSGLITVDFDRRWPREWGREAAGITITNRRNSRISSAEIHFNNEFFQWSTSGSPSMSDIQGVATHEIGHAIGFGHSFYFESTMYWSGGDARLRTLAPDDQRGIRFLYGPADNQAGRMCDTCLTNDDCENFCIGLERGRAHCGQACNSASDCPNNAECFELTNGSRSCAPLAFACSDDPVLADGSRLALEPGDYCFGADQCRSGSLCLPLETSAECIRNCNPSNNTCPGGGECYATGDPDNPGLCIPPGNVPEGGVCGSFQNRCQDGLECAYIGDRPRCFSYCQPGGQCAPGFGCSPFDNTRWVCLALDGPQEGEPCIDNLCAGGLTCMNVGGQSICAEGCLPEESITCDDGRRCFTIRDGVGGCSPGTVENGDPCTQNLECKGGYCLFQRGERLCAQGCEASSDCGTDETCQTLNSGETVCLASNQGTDVVAVDSGTIAPMPVDQSTRPPVQADMSPSTSPDAGRPGINFPPAFADDPSDESDSGLKCSNSSADRSTPFSILTMFLLILNLVTVRRVPNRGGSENA